MAGSEGEVESMQWAMKRGERERGGREEADQYHSSRVGQYPLHAGLPQAGRIVGAKGGRRGEEPKCKRR